MVPVAVRPSRKRAATPVPRSVTFSNVNLVGKPGTGVACQVCASPPRLGGGGAIVTRPLLPEKKEIAGILAGSTKASEIPVESRFR